MRLGLVLFGDLQTLSGGYLYDHYLVQHLRERGDEVEVVSFPSRPYLRALADNFSLAVYDRLSRMRVDLLLQDELHHASLVLLNRRLRVPRISIVHHLRSSEPRQAWLNRIYRQIERAYLRSVDAMIFNSDATRVVVEGLVGPGRPAVVARPAGDRLQPTLSDRDVQKRAQEPGPLRVLFLGNIIRRKGLAVLVEALRLLQPDVWRLTVAGRRGLDPAYERRILRAVQEAGLADRVLFTGALNEPAVEAALQDHHVLVLPSYYEGYGIAYLEAMGFGLPAIGTRAGGVVEIITHNRDGFLVEPGAVSRLAAYLSALATDRSLLARMGMAARRRYASHPTWAQTGAQIRSFLCTVLNS